MTLKEKILYWHPENQWRLCFEEFWTTRVWPRSSTFWGFLMCLPWLTRNFTLIRSRRQLIDAFTLLLAFAGVRSNRICGRTCACCLATGCMGKKQSSQT